MISFRVAISNYFTKVADTAIKNIFVRSKRISKNKTFEIQIAWCPPTYLTELDIDLNWTGSSHAGPSVHFEIYKFMVDVRIFDIRHWDYQNSTWEN